MQSFSILARNDVSLRSSVIFLSLALNEPLMAARFLELAVKFANRYSRREIKR
jgi:hypothetical protein